MARPDDPPPPVHEPTYLLTPRRLVVLGVLCAVLGAVILAHLGGGSTPSATPDTTRETPVPPPAVSSPAPSPAGPPAPTPAPSVRTVPPGRAGIPRGTPPTPGPVNLADPTAVGEAFTVATFSYDANIDVSPADAQRRSMQFATPSYAAKLQGSGTPARRRPLVHLGRSPRLHHPLPGREPRRRPPAGHPHDRGAVLDGHDHRPQRRQLDCPDGHCAGVRVPDPDVLHHPVAGLRRADPVRHLSCPRTSVAAGRRRLGERDTASRFLGRTLARGLAHPPDLLRRRCLTHAPNLETAADNGGYRLAGTPPQRDCAAPR